MLQSLSPLALLTIIRNFSFQMSVSEFSLNLATLDEFFRLNSVLIVVFILCDNINANATLLERMYKERVESALEEVLQKDERFQKISKGTRRKIKEYR